LSRLEIKAATRTTKGNGPARAMRRQGRIPAILYGRGTEPLMLSVDKKELENTVKQGAVGRSLYNLVIDDGKQSKAAMVKELQTHPVTDEILHIDFYAVDMERKVRVNVPVVTTGKAKGVELGGMLQIIRREVEVLCLPGLIPESLVVDISDLDLGDSLHVRDIPLGENIEIPADVNYTVLTILSPKVEEEEEEEEEEAEEAAEGEEKSEDGEGEGE